MFLYGKSLYHGGKIVDSRPVLLATLPLAPQHRAEIHYLVAATFLADANPSSRRPWRKTAGLRPIAADPTSSRGG